MTTPTIRAALDEFQQAANRGTAVYLSLELVQELRDALEVEPDADGVPLGPFSEDDLRQQWNARADEFNQWDSLDTSEQLAWAQARAIGADRCARTALKAEPEPDDGDDAIDRWIKSRPGWPDDWPAVTHSQLTALIGEALEHWGRPATPPAPEPGEVGQLVAWLKEEAEAYLNTCGTNLASQNLDNAATLIQQQDAELAALRGVPVSPALIVRFEFEVLDEHDQTVASGDASTLEEAAREGRHYLSEYQQDEPCKLELRRVEVFNSDAIPLPAPQAGEVQPPHPTFLDAIRLAQGCHDYSGGHSGPLGEAFQDGVGTVVAVLKKAALGPWDSQTMAVFGVGSASQAGEGEA
jgi:hypothetical protein